MPKLNVNFVALLLLEEKRKNQPNFPFIISSFLRKKLAVTLLTDANLMPSGGEEKVQLCQSNLRRVLLKKSEKIISFREA